MIAAVEVGDLTDVGEVLEDPDTQRRIAAVMALAGYGLKVTGLVKDVIGQQSGHGLQVVALDGLAEGMHEPTLGYATIRIYAVEIRGPGMAYL